MHQGFSSLGIDQVPKKIQSSAVISRSNITQITYNTVASKGEYIS